MAKLTNDFLKIAMPEPGRGRLEQRDDGPGSEPGLIFRVTDKGVRSWSIRYVNSAGEHRRKTIGPFPAIGLAAARARAREIKGSIAGKVDVVGQERQSKVDEQRKKMNRVAPMAEAYFADAALGLHRATTKPKPKRPGTLSEERRIYEKLVKPRFGNMAMTDITRRDVSDFVDRQTRKAPSRGGIAVTSFASCSAMPSSRRLSAKAPS